MLYLLLKPFLFRLLTNILAHMFFFYDIGPEYIFDLLHVHTIFFKDHFDEILDFHEENCTDIFIRMLLGPEGYQEYHDICYTDYLPFKEIQYREALEKDMDLKLKDFIHNTSISKPLYLDIFNIENAINNHNGFDPYNFNGDPIFKITDRDCFSYFFSGSYFDTDCFYSNLYTNLYKITKEAEQFDSDPYLGFDPDSIDLKNYLDFLAKKLNPNLTKYSTSLDTLGETFPPADGSLIYDFFSDGVVKYKFPQYFFTKRDLPSYLSNLSSLLPDKEVFPLDGYSLDGLLLNRKIEKDPGVPIFRFSKNIFSFLKTVGDFFQNPAGLLEPKLDDFVVDVIRGYRRPKYTRFVFYKNKQELRKPFSYRTPWKRERFYNSEKYKKQQKEREKSNKN